MYKRNFLLAADAISSFLVGQSPNIPDYISIFRVQTDHFIESLIYSVNVIDRRTLIILLTQNMYTCIFTVQITWISGFEIKASTIYHVYCLGQDIFQSGQIYILTLSSGDLTHYLAEIETKIDVRQDDTDVLFSVQVKKLSRVGGLSLKDNVANVMNR